MKQNKSCSASVYGVTQSGKTSNQLVIWHDQERQIMVPSFLTIRAIQMQCSNSKIVIMKWAKTKCKLDALYWLCCNLYNMFYFSLWDFILIDLQTFSKVNEFGLKIYIFDEYYILWLPLVCPQNVGTTQAQFDLLQSFTEVTQSSEATQPEARTTWAGLSCGYCNKSFKTSGGLNRHMSLVRKSFIVDNC